GGNATEAACPTRSRVRAAVTGVGPRAAAHAIIRATLASHIALASGRLTAVGLFVAAGGAGRNATEIARPALRCRRAAVTGGGTPAAPHPIIPATPPLHIPPTT